MGPPSRSNKRNKAYQAEATRETRPIKQKQHQEAVQTEDLIEEYLRDPALQEIHSTHQTRTARPNVLPLQ
nr:hypothetical protein BgiMline_016180 [Biomphalaria glabrata]